MSNKEPKYPKSKTKHYSGALTLAPDGTPLCAISHKKANWYLSRDLAERVPAPKGYEGFPVVLRLKFQPQVVTSTPNDFHTQLLNNACVICGSTEDLTLHHVVPSAIRVHFPVEVKSHQHGWCVLVCDKHHLQAETVSRAIYGKQMDEIGKLLAKSDGKTEISIIKKLRKFRHQMDVGMVVTKGPRRKRTPDRPRIEVWIGKVDLLKDYDEWAGADWRTKAKLRIQELNKIERDIKGELVKQFVEENGGVEKMKLLFKEAFLSLNPKHMPSGFLQDYS